MTDEPVVAWRCEECHNWHPASEEVHQILVLEIGPLIETAGMVMRAHVPQQMAVCSDCRAEITGERLGFETR